MNEYRGENLLNYNEHKCVAFINHERYSGTIEVEGENAYVHTDKYGCILIYNKKRGNINYHFCTLLEIDK